MIENVSDKPISSSQGREIDLRGETLMPGLIDCHVHVVASEVNLDKNALLPNSLVAARAIGIMRGMLMRGFTTVRDLGGADFGLQQAVEDGTILGPRLVICGKGFSQTGGHSRFSRPLRHAADGLAGRQAWRARAGLSTASRPCAAPFARRSRAAASSSS